MYPSKDSPRTFLYTVFLITEFIALISTLCCVIWAAGYHGGMGSEDHNQLLNLHMFLMPLSSVILTGNAMVVFRLIHFWDTNKVKTLHALLHFLCFFIMIGGVAAAVSAKESYSPNLGHLFTFHSWVAIINITLYLFNTILASLIFCCLSQEVRESYAGIHSYLGIANFVLSTTTACIGIAQKTTLYIPDLPNLPNESILGFLTGLGLIIFTANIFYITVNPFFEWEKIGDI